MIQISLLAFTINCAGQPSPWIVYGFIYENHKQSKGQDCLSFNCEEANG